MDTFDPAAVDAVDCNHEFLASLFFFMIFKEGRLQVFPVDYACGGHSGALIPVAAAEYGF